MFLVTQGLRIKTDCRYIKFTQSEFFDIRINESESCFILMFPKGYMSTNVFDSHVEVLNPHELTETDYVRIYNPIINLNGLKFTKLVQHDYSLSQFLVKDLDKFVMNFDENHCEVLIPVTKSWDLKSYTDLMNKNIYLKILDASELKSLNNYYSINLTNKDLSKLSTNTFEFGTKKKYTKYLIEGIHFQDQFIRNITAFAKNYGLDVLRLPIDKNSKSIHYLTYRFSDLNRQSNYKSMDEDVLRFAVRQTSHIDFTISTPDLVIFNDFRTKYQNLDFISNFTEFVVMDKLGRDWRASINWTPLDTSFNQDYSQNEQGVIAFESRFSADLDYWTVYDQTFNRAQEVIANILSTNTSETKSKSQIVTFDV